MTIIGFVGMEKTVLTKKFMLLQVKLHFTESALRSIARKAISKNTGARGLRSILENVLVDAMYEVCHNFSFGQVICLRCVTWSAAVHNLQALGLLHAC